MDAEPLTTEQVDRLRVEVYPDRAALGRAAAASGARWLREAAARGRARIIFAYAPSQREFLAALAVEDVPWPRVEAFHMDEYIGLSPDAEACFSAFLERSLFSRVSAGAFHVIDGSAAPAGEAERYGALLRAAPIDVVCCGVGENGHLAFNEPGSADFDDPVPVKVVQLEEASRRQQVHDGTFPTLESVPRAALTLTVPALMAGAQIAAVVPGPLKRDAVHRLLRGPVESACPASVLRRHPDAVLYLDAGAYDR
jgi:glucosamine-6-phosphate deaminase